MKLAYRVYLDSCALGRIFDTSPEPRVRREAEVMESLMSMFRRSELIWITSAAVDAELKRNPDREGRAKVLELLHDAGEKFEINASVVRRTKQLKLAGYGAFDALHLAFAEGANADVLLTTDDRFEKRARRGVGVPVIAVRNPVDWLNDVR